MTEEGLARPRSPAHAGALRSFHGSDAAPPREPASCTAGLATARRDDRSLWRLRCSGAQIDCELALGLAALFDAGDLLPGSVRRRDFVREHLGLREGRAHWLARLGRGMRSLPEINEALRAGRLQPSQAMQLLSVIGPQTPRSERQAWIDWVTGKTVRAVRSTVAAETARRRGGGAGERGSPGAAVGAPAAAAGGVLPPPAAADTGDELAGGWVSIPAPAHVAELWEGAIDLVRRLAGGQLSLGNCAELLAADYLAAVGAGSREDASAKNDGTVGRMDRLGRAMRRAKAHGQPDGAAVDPASRPGDDESQPGDAAAAAGDVGGDSANRAPVGSTGAAIEVSDLLQQAAAVRARVAPGPPAGAESSATWPRVRWDPQHEEPPVRVQPDDCGDALRLAAMLRQLDAMKAIVRLELAGGLAGARRTRHWQALGFGSFGEYCRERLGLTVRQAQRLLRWRSGLDRFPQLSAAYRDGRINYAASLLLLRVLHASNEAEWVAWASGVTYRELERNVEMAQLYTPPGAIVRVPDGLPRQQVAGSGDRRTRGISDGGTVEDATTFAPPADDTGTPPDTPAGQPGAATTPNATTFAPAADDTGNPADTPAGQPSSTTTPDATTFAPPADAPGLLTSGGVIVPRGFALPPRSPGGCPRISGFGPGAILREPERCVARIRFWAADDALDVFRRALRRCRQEVGDASRRDWTYLQVILVRFLNGIDTGPTRRLLRRHAVIARDGFWCRCPGCTSRARLHQHHLWQRSRLGGDEHWNQIAICAAHHNRQLHGGLIQMGGWAPRNLVARVGIDPRSGCAFASYRNEHRIPDAEARARLAGWRRWWRQRLCRKLARRVYASFPWLAIINARVRRGEWSGGGPAPEVLGD